MRLIGRLENRPKSLAAVYSAEEIIELTGARVAVGMVPDEAGEIATDTRSELSGSWFVALVGKTFDGHDFIGDAFSAGALGCIVADRPSYPIAATSFPLLAVDDTEEALAVLARNWRRRTRKKLVLVAATDLDIVSPLAQSMYEALDRSLLQTAATVSPSNDFSAPTSTEAPARGPHFSTQFSLDPAAAFPPSDPLFCGEETVQSILSNWKLSASDILGRFLNLPDEVEYLVADFSPLPLERAVWLIEALSPNALLLAEDSFAYARMSKGAPELHLLQEQMVEAMNRCKGKVFTDSESLAERLSLTYVSATSEGGDKTTSYQPVLQQLGI
ncbi:hypothetical protein BH11CYA1_BH11CYA1_20690 [soil metagenome]